MRFILTLLFLIVIFATPVSAETRHHIQSSWIRIEVDCVEHAANVINSLNGYNLESGVFLIGNQPEGSFRRRVDPWAYRQVQDSLRGLGFVLSESEGVTYLGQELQILEQRLAINAQEIQRISAMMEESATLDVLMLFSDRLGTLSVTRDEILGRRNQILVQTGSPVIHISLIQALPPEEEVEEAEEEEEEELPPTFLSQLGNSFVGSITQATAFTQALLIGIASMFFPIVILAAICIPVVKFALPKLRASGQRPIKKEVESE